MNAASPIVASEALPPAVPDCFPYGVKPEATLRTSGEFIQAARALVPILKAHAAEANRIRRPVNACVEAMVRAGLMGLLRPRMYGGAGLELSDLFDVVSVLAEGCPSTGWDYVVWELHNWLMGGFEKQAQDEYFGVGDVLLACGPNPAGPKSWVQARPVDGGYMLSGRWRFGSGSTHSNWAHLNGRIEGREVDGQPELRAFAVPRSQYVVLDTWFLRGLRGTGSHDVSIEQEIFVPEHRSLAHPSARDGSPRMTPGARLHSETVAYRMPLAPPAHLAAAVSGIGATKAAIEAFKELTKKRVHHIGQKQIDRAASAIRLARAQCEVEAAELLFRATIREVEAEIRAGRNLTVELRAKARMISGFVPNLCKQSIMSLVEAGGAVVMVDDSPLSNAMLDISCISAHGSTEYDLGTESYGRVLLGLEPSNNAI